MLFLCLLVLTFTFDKKFLPISIHTFYPYICVFAFLLGFNLYFLRSQLKINTQLIIALFLFSYLFKGTCLYQELKFTAILVLLLFVSFLPFVNKIRLPVDLSMAVFLYSFPLQQFFSFYFKATPPYINFLLTLPVVTLLALFSHYVIEKKCYRLADYLVEKISTFLYSRKNDQNIEV